ncbi:MAG: PAS domain-containing protein, partial [Nitrospira sp.]|nr:PAS domain-containing protein [Nitrospira sp.]
CLAKGDPVCRFIMAPPSRIEGHIAGYMKREPELAKRITKYEVPAFFKRKEVEEALRESEERFRLIAETIDGAFWMADVPIERMFYISPAYERIWGRSCESLYRNPRSFIETIHPEDRERVLCDFEVQKIGQPFDHEYRIARPDGTIRWIWGRGFPVRDKSENVIRYVGIAQDITERKRAEEKMEKLLKETGRINKELQEKAANLERFNRLMVGRELEMINLKAEVNDLLEKSGAPKKYKTPEKVKE